MVSYDIRALWIVIGINVMVLLFAGGSSASTITVPDDYAKIQWAIDNATTGDTIEVHDGTYYENVNVTRQLALRGIGNPVVNAALSGSVITLSADGIILEGFTATWSGWDYSGIAVSSNNNTLIRNNASNNGISGIRLYSSSNNTLLGNIASNNYDGIWLSSPSNNNMLIDNIASNNRCGISLYDSSNNNTLNGNIASNNTVYGIWLSSSSNNILKNNLMSGNEANFFLRGDSFSDFNNQIDTSNLVDGKPVYYVKGALNRVYDSFTNAGSFYCINCINVTIKNIELNKNIYGIFEIV